VAKLMHYVICVEGLWKTMIKLIRTVGLNPGPLEYKVRVSRQSC
jgi:hypothetical protein